VKFRNKQQVYRCIDEGKIKIYLGTVIKEIWDGEVVIADARTQEEKASIPIDYVLALIGGAPPIGFLESVGIGVPRG